MGIKYYLGLEKEKRCGIMKRKKVGVDMAMLADIRGRIRKFNLSQNDSFLAILEALVNSIQSGSTNIHIEVIREAEEEILTKEKIRKIKGFKIIDDGEGFTKKNFEAFNTLDTTNKYHLGGKGVGRLSWLKVFEKINIERKELLKQLELKLKEQYSFLPIARETKKAYISQSLIVGQNFEGITNFNMFTNIGKWYRK